VSTATARSVPCDHHRKPGGIVVGPPVLGAWQTAMPGDAEQDGLQQAHLAGLLGYAPAYQHHDTRLAIARMASSQLP
jgi:hypothetical protein